MATSKPKNLPVLKITCDHNGGLEYWCRDCAFEAARLLQAENERFKFALERAKPRGKK